MAHIKFSFVFYFQLNHHKLLFCILCLKINTKNLLSITTIDVDHCVAIDQEEIFSYKDLNSVKLQLQRKQILYTRLHSIIYMSIKSKHANPPSLQY